MEPVFNGSGNPFEASSLKQHPLGHVLRNWTTDPAGFPPQIASAIEVLAQMRDRNGHVQPIPELLIALCRLGKKEKAANLIDGHLEKYSLEAG